MPLHIAQLGSSFAAGPGIAPVANKRALRSGANFASLVARRVGGGARLTDLAVSGATLPQLLLERQPVPLSVLGSVFGRRFPPQIDGLPGDADVVLVLGGGNDLGYVGGMFEDTLAALPWPLGPLVRALVRLLGYGAPVAAAAELGVDGLAIRYGRVLDAVHARVPQARVLVVEYVSLLGPDVRPAGGGDSGSGSSSNHGGDAKAVANVAFGADRVEHHRGVAAKLLEATARAADAEERASWCARVAVDAPSRAHGVGSADPWVNGFGWRLFYAGAAFHPNAKGMRAVSELVYQKLVELRVVEEGAATTTAAVTATPGEEQPV